MSSTALTVIPPQQSAMSYGDMLRPTSLDQAMKLADMLARSDMVPKDYRGKPGNIVAAVQMGAEVGLAPMQALQNIAVINGRPSVWGDAMLALVQSHPAFEWIRERIEGDGDARAAVCEVKRRGNEQPCAARFSVADAKKAGLWGKQGPWSQYPDRMLKMRARGFACRDAFADALRGLQSAEESQDIPTERVEVISTTPAVSTAQPKPSPTERVKAKVAGPSLADVLARIEAAQTDDELRAVAGDAKKLSNGDRDKARAAYKAREEQLRAPAHNPDTGEVADPDDMPPMSDEEASAFAD